MSSDVRGFRPTNPPWLAEPARTRPASARSTGRLRCPTDAGFWRKLFAFAGPGYLVAVGYMDPGNWATDLAGGARYGYTLLSVILISNLMAILLQALAVRLGIGSGRDLAQACRDSYSRPTTLVLWVLCEIAIAACDLAEVIGAAIALNLLFGLPAHLGRLPHRARRAGHAVPAEQGVPLRRGAGRRPDRRHRRVLRGGAVAVEARAGRGRGRVHPDAREVLTDPNMLYIAVGILGRDRDAPQPVSALVDRADPQVRGHLCQQARGDPLRVDRFVDRADVGALHQRRHPDRGGGGVPRHRHDEVADISDAYKLLSPLLGAGAASTLFAVALLFAGQNATLTGTLAGQIVMEGFVNIRLRPWLRRLITRLVAIVPAVIVVMLLRRARRRLAAHPQPGDSEPAAAVRRVPARQLHRATGDKMGAFVAPVWMRLLAWMVAVIIAALNVWLLYQTFAG